MELKLTTWQLQLERLEGAYAPNTIRSYHTDVKQFVGWCEEANVPPFPIEGETLVAYLGHIQAALSYATIRRKIAVVRRMHALLGHGPAPRDEDFNLAYRRMKRTKSLRQRKARGWVAARRHQAQQGRPIRPRAAVLWVTEVRKVTPAVAPRQTERCQLDFLRHELRALHRPPDLRPDRQQNHQAVNREAEGRAPTGSGNLWALTARGRRPGLAHQGLQHLCDYAGRRVAQPIRPAHVPEFGRAQRLELGCTHLSHRHLAARRAAPICDVHDCVQVPLDTPAVKPPPIQRHGLDVAAGGVDVDGVGQLNFSTGARGLVPQNIKDVWGQDVAPNTCEVRGRTLGAWLLDEAGNGSWLRARDNDAVLGNIGSAHFHDAKLRLASPIKATHQVSGNTRAVKC